MKNIYKKIFLYFNYLSNFYNIFIFFIKTIITSLVLLSCSILSEDQKIFFNQVTNTKKNNQCKIHLQEKENYTPEIVKNKLKKNKNIHITLRQDIHKNENYVTSKLSKNMLIKKTIYIKKNSNFFKSACESGLNLFDINSIIKALEWNINFHKLNINSQFDLVFLKEKINLKNKNILLGIKINNLNKTYYAIKAFNGNFYDINGCNQSPMIMDFSLLKKYRISSHFNLHRIHPVTHYESRHLGVDLAMLQGTSVLATTNGKIVKTGFNKISGLYIVLNNKNQFLTKYMHLKKIFVKVGQNIKIHQKIALSGNTGRTTGAHLHYEIWINNHAINPIHAHSYFIEPLTKKELIAYFKISKIVLSKLK
ncbi:peptidoglycan DD-metalloendopeptidase family protein [Buchnera aphidicola (Aphis aurantii)]|uniref:peptidoglycan DD-metalloendopeptidase family protein n=1 Tax=Buchnera aphidicola TaxID=9 RepID=UPI0031B73002